MSEDRENERSVRSWRTIRQDVASRAMSTRGRQRQRMAWIKVVALVALVGLSSWGLYAIVRTWENDRATLATAVHSKPVREIVVLTDGVLNREWVARTIALPTRTTLMALDLAALRTKLMASGQVSVAVLTRNFPDTLVVTLQERTPLARIQVEAGPGRTRQLLVARDGVVYDGANYDQALLVTLPWLAGFTLRRVEDGALQPIEGMDQVATLLTTAQVQAPHLYRDWLTVSLARLAEHRELVVKSQDVPEIVFNMRYDCFIQLAQLDHVIDATRAAVSETNQLLSVSLGDPRGVTARMTLSPDELVRLPASTPPSFNLQPSPSRKTKRDL